MERRHGSEGRGLFEDIEPEMTLEEAGALLGISDHTAMLAEKSAARKLRSFFDAMGTSSMRDFFSLTDEQIDHTLATFAVEDRPYSERFGWYELSSAKSLNDGIESLKDVAVAYALLRVTQANRFRVPLLYRDKCDSPFVAIGRVESISILGYPGRRDQRVSLQGRSLVPPRTDYCCCSTRIAQATSDARRRHGPCHASRRSPRSR